MDNFKYIYGPVYSWRLGTSLGIDPLSDKDKICNLDCVYCQLGKTVYFSNERKVYVPTHEIIDEILQLPNLKLDHLTICGRGEPTLAKNLGEIIKQLRKIRSEKIAVITNSSYMWDRQVSEDLNLCNRVIAKLDAFNQESFESIDKSGGQLNFDKIITGLKSFRRSYKGILALQIMFFEENKPFAKEIAKIVNTINADEIEINTPLRPCAVKPLLKEELDEIKSHFGKLKAVTVYEKDRKDCKPLSERETIKRHGNYKAVARN